MALGETTRQVVAGLLAALAFLGLYLGLTLVWWVAFVAALAVYGATLLVFPRKKRADETMLSAQVSEADLIAAGQSMTAAATRLEAAMDRVPGDEQGTIAALLTHVTSIRDQVTQDPDDYRRARRFISSYLGNMVDTVERYADLAQKSRGRHPERLAPLAAQIHDFVPALEKIDTACLENDFRALESQVDALAMQLKRG